MKYQDRKLEKLCTDEREMRKKRGDIADRLRLRVNALRAAKTVGELATIDPLGNWHQLTGDHLGKWAGKLSRNERLLVRPEGESEPWDAVSVTVIDIDDYH
ncbi:type II toxin-antitoxin system RelE/ParE family toxin [Mycobacteroides abscessus]|uniref:plasmid maintenance system killer protein n=1 Tax=Mycobacteroides abscessus TaxID=36809 RepID=UPI0009D3BF49|nr:plasmid maintenance system killer protein [Mycobacteroides abscessus]SLI43220.1 plasmid maintenance system killer protein [Mycobacteroides abscessus subsp. abscessus]